MTEPAWTPEPWSVMLQNLRRREYAGSRTYWEVPIQVGARGNGGNVIALVHTGGPGAGWSTKESVQANADRIVSCVNACAGLPDPERDVREMLDTLEQVIEDVRLALECVDANREREARQHITKIRVRARAALARLAVKGEKP